ncbi:MAG TPA: hypothetical protein VI756_10325 [Blastocatellia bacterium]
MKELFGSSCCRFRLSRVWLILLLIQFVSVWEVRAQQLSGPSVEDHLAGRVKVLDQVGPWKMDLLRQPGVLLEQGNNTTPVGIFKLTTYRIDEVTPALPLHGEIDGQPTSIEKAWRITILGGLFRVRDAAPMVFIDDKLVGIALEGADLKSISVIVFDRSLIRTGASISMGYGERDPNRTVLPEKIKLEGR